MGDAGPRSLHPRPTGRVESTEEGDHLNFGLADVHLWIVAWDATQCPAEDSLSPDERERAGRFRFATDRRRFTICRGTLRVLLGMYLETDPQTIQFRYGPHGKPELAGPKESDVSFNVAHAGTLGICAFARGRRVGVDVEAVKTLSDADRIAEQFFSPNEVSSLKRLPAEQREKGFFNCWTRKEAYLKALGDGLARPLNSFDVSIDPNEPPRLLRVRDNPSETNRWSMHAFTPAPGYVGAAAVEGADCRTTVMCYPKDVTYEQRRA